MKTSAAKYFHFR